MGLVLDDHVSFTCTMIPFTVSYLIQYENGHKPSLQGYMSNYTFCGLTEMRCNLLESYCASNLPPRFVSIHPVPPSYRPSYEFFKFIPGNRIF